MRDDIDYIAVAHQHEQDRRAYFEPVIKDRLVDKQYKTILDCRDRLKELGDEEWKMVEQMLGHLSYAENPEALRQNELLTKGIQTVVLIAEKASDSGTGSG